MKKSVLILLCLFGIVEAHEIRFTNQYVNMNKRDDTGWQHDLSFRYQVNEQWKVGAQGRLLEKFGQNEQALGLLLNWKPKTEVSFDFSYFTGNGNEILPKDDIILTTYWGMMAGLSPFLTIRKSDYTQTNIYSATLGMEFEKIINFIFVPQLMLGRAKFKSPSSTEGLYSFGLKGIFYKEEFYKLFAFYYRGKEASQGIIGASNFRVDTQSVGIGGAYYFTKDFAAELTVDYTDYDQLNDEYLTTTLDFKYLF